MSSENENIEAKLCSYVEGDLDAAGRAEIKRYLAANPRYRPLISELSATRGLLRNLPRDSAPSELLETIQSQLERSSLLGDAESDPANPMRFNRWPVISAWAAVLLLTAGLAAVIYRVLPSNKTQPEFVLLHPAPGETAQTNTLDSPAAPKAQMDQVLKKNEITASTVAGEAEKSLSDKPVPATGGVVDAKLAMAKDQWNMLRDGLPSGGAILNGESGQASGIASNTTNNGEPPQRRMLASVLGSAATGGNGSQNVDARQNMQVVINAPDTAAANEQVVAYLTSNKIPYETPAGPAGSLSLSVPADQVTAVQSQVQSPSQGQRRNQSDDLWQQQASKSVSDSSRARMQSAASSVVADKEIASLAKDASSVIVAHNLTRQQAQSLNEALGTKSASLGFTGSTNGGVIFNSVTTSPAMISSVAPSSAVTSIGMSGIGMSGPLVATTLSSTAEDPTTSPSIALAGASRSITVPAPALAAGDTVRIVAEDNSLHGVEAMNEPQVIDADGNIGLPMVGKVKVAGLSEAEAQEAIHLAYKLAKSPTDATWKVERTAVVAAAAVRAPLGDLGATTQPAGPLASPAAPASPSTIALAPTTSPAAPSADVAAAAARDGGEDRVDVTILVRKQPVVASTELAASDAQAALPTAAANESTPGPATVPATNPAEPATELNGPSIAPAATPASPAVIPATTAPSISK